MPEKKKDIWEKISDTAAAAGRTIGDEYQKLKLSHDIWLLDRDLYKAYARAGRIIYNRSKAGKFQADSELEPIFDDIAQLREAIKEEAKRRENIRAQRTKSGVKSEPPDTGGETSDTGGEIPKAQETETTSHSAEMEFLDDTDIIFSCPGCGARFDIDSGMVPNFCAQCGYHFGQD